MRFAPRRREDRGIRWAAAIAVIAAAVATGCGRSGGGGASGFPAGNGAVFGAVLGRDFNFAPGQVTVLSSAAGTATDLSVYLCEFGCDPAALAIAPDSRAVLVIVRAQTVPIAAGTQFTVGQSARALAAARQPPDVAASTGTSQTRMSNATAGTITLSQGDTRPGGHVAGRFELQFEDGGALTGSFDGVVPGTLPIPSDGGTP